MDQERYLGVKKVASVAVTNMKTPLGSDIVEVTYESGEKEIMPKKAFEQMVTPEALGGKDPYGDLMNRKFAPLLRDVQLMIMEYDLKGQELSPFFQKLLFNLEDAFYRAINWKWTGNDLKHAPGGDPLGTKTLLEAHQIIMSIPENETREYELSKRAKEESERNQEGGTV